MRTEVITIVYQPPKILLGMKKQRFGAGKYNGFGGGVEEGESLERCAIRETLEEARIEIINPKKFGEILFQFEAGEQDHLVHFLESREFYGTPTETDEMKPEWFNEENLPYDKMWVDDKYWMPIFLKGEKFKGHFIFNKDRKIKYHTLEGVK
jgi:8-oxo-dGTP diphosphatase/2-hydroxy-dATP diphosphatase